ncbi:MAG: right-handed parallel beta-helix repeat-containing protein [Candidatus Zipacnadales bacterium]
MVVRWQLVRFLALWSVGVLSLHSVAQEPPPPLNVYWGEIPPGDRIFFIAPSGDNANAGTEDRPWATLDFGTSQAQPGDVFVLRGGVYFHSATIKISRSGTADKPITVIAHPGETPVLDFSAQTEESSNNGIRLNGWYWRVVGITVRYAGHNGIRMDGSYNVLEQVTAYGNRDTGIHMAGNASNNLIKNCDSFHNFNSIGRVGNNADGFGAKFDILPGNRFYGCRAWENSDDGFDFWRAANTITLENCWSFHNGDPAVFGNPANFEGAGNGYKLGGDYVPGDHIVVRCLAFDNLGPGGQAKGFDHNNNTGALTLIHNTAFHNGRNFFFPRDPVRGQSLFVNNLSVASGVLATVPPGAVVAGNSWQGGETIGQDVFLSVDTQLAKLPRERDGSLPAVGLLRPKPGSAIVDRGVPVGLPYCGSAPDLGAYEHEVGDWQPGFVERGNGEHIKELVVYDVENAHSWSLRADFAAGASAYGDENYLVVSVPQGLYVWEWIQTSNLSRAKNYLLTQAEFATTEPLEMFVGHSVRIALKPEWLSEYEQTGLTLTVAGQGGFEEQLSLFRKITAPGERVHLGRNSRDGTTSALMYIVLVGSLSQGIAGGDFAKPTKFGLLEVYPNPSRGRSTILYTVSTPGLAELKVFDVRGRQVAQLASEPVAAGTWSVIWDSGRLPAGVYFCRLTMGQTCAVREVLLLR